MKCVCSLSYPTCNAHAPYCHPWPVRFCYIFSDYVIKGTIFGKNTYRTYSLSVGFSLWFVSEIFLVLRTTERDMITSCILVFMSSASYSYQILKKYEFSRHIFEKISNVKFRKIRSSESRVVLCGQRDGRTGR